MNKKVIKSIIFIVFISLLLTKAIWNYEIILNALNFIVSVLRPVIIGFVIAFILKDLYDKFHELFSRMMPKAKNDKITRAISLVSVYLFIIIIITVIILIIIPNYKSSFTDLKDNFSGYIENFSNWITNVGNKYNIEFLKSLSLNDIENKITEYTNDISRLIINFGKGALGFTASLAGIITDIILGFVISIYFLYGKKTLTGQCKKIVYAFFNNDKAQKIIQSLNNISSIFSNFIVGQITEAFILGTLCTVGLLIFRFNYAVIIGLLVGITSLIPIVGAFISTIPSALLLLIIDPKQALWFVVFIIVLQQLEGNLIYPRVVGTKLGLPALWVLLGITIGGGLFGVLGMLLGVPTMSVIYEYMRKTVNKRLDDKNINIQ